MTTTEQILKDMILKYELNNLIDTDHAVAQQTEQTQEPIEKRLRFLADLIDPSVNTTTRNLDVNGEIIKYFQLCQDFNRNDDIKVFWKRNEKNLPMLFALTRTIFAIPVTSADAEQSFSVAGSLLRVARANESTPSAQGIFYP
jgi:hypothetical protein